MKVQVMFDVAVAVMVVALGAASAAAEGAGHHEANGYRVKFLDTHRSNNSMASPMHEFEVRVGENARPVVVALPGHYSSALGIFGALAAQRATNGHDRTTSLSSAMDRLQVAIRLRRSMEEHLVSTVAGLAEALRMVRDAELVRAAITAH